MTGPQDSFPLEFRTTALSGSLRQSLTALALRTMVLKRCRFRETRLRCNHNGKQFELSVPVGKFKSLSARVLRVVNTKSFAKHFLRIKKELAAFRQARRDKSCRRAIGCRWLRVMPCASGIGNTRARNTPSPALQIHLKSSLYVVVARRHSGRGHNAENGLLSIALCHSSARARNTPSPALQIHLKSSLYVVVARRHSGRGHNAENGLLSIALCHSSVRNKCQVGDQILVVTSVSSTLAQPPEYAEAISKLKAQSLTGKGKMIRKVVLYGLVSEMISAEEYYTEYKDRRDAWYKVDQDGPYTNSDGLSFSLRCRFRSGGDIRDHKFGPLDLLPVILCRKFRVWGTNLDGSPQCPLQLPNNWAGRNCCRFDSRQRAVFRTCDEC